MEKFAFIIHPIDPRRDVGRKYKLARYLPERVVEALLLRFKPKVISHIRGVRSLTGAEAEGWLVGCPLSPRQMLELDQEFVYERIAACGRLAAQQGAKVVGLGAFTSVVGDAGLTIQRKLEGVISVTSGNSYTTYTAIEGLFKAAEMMNVDVPQAHAAVVGATGSIGQVCARMVAGKVRRVSLIGRNEERLANVANALRNGTRTTISASTDINALRDADLVVTVSSAVDTLIRPEHLKSGAVICDVARPRDVSKQVAEARDDVLVIEGGVVEMPGAVDFGFNFGFPSGTAYACMAETAMMALEGTYEPYSLGRALDADKTIRIGELAQKHGFKLAGFRSFEREVTMEEIQRIRNNASRPRRAVSPANQSPS
jgi:predicted amino acid dehydrogenase